MNFRLSDFEIDEISGDIIIAKGTNQLVCHYPFDVMMAETRGKWFKTAEELPKKNLLVEVKSDYFPDGENYAGLVDTEHGMNWFYLGSDPIHNEAKTIPFEYVSEWRLGEWLLGEGHRKESIYE